MRIKLFCIFLCVVLTAPAWARPITEEDVGYSVESAHEKFVFNEDATSEQPNMCLQYQNLKHDACESCW